MFTALSISLYGHEHDYYVSSVRKPAMPITNTAALSHIYQFNGAMLTPQPLLREHYRADDCDKLRARVSQKGRYIL